MSEATPTPSRHQRVSDLREFKETVGATVRLGASGKHGYVDVSVRVNLTDPRVAPHLAALRDAFRAIAAEAVTEATS